MKNDELKNGVPIMRIFKARAHAGKEQALAQKLATTSAALVRDKPALIGYLAASPAQSQGRDFVFTTIWQSFEGMKELFGEQWKVSLLPPGYEDLIETCSVEHYELTDKLLRG